MRDDRAVGPGAQAPTFLSVTVTSSTHTMDAGGDGSAMTSLATKVVALRCQGISWIE